MEVEVIKFGIYDNNNYKQHEINKLSKYVYFSCE